MGSTHLALVTGIPQGLKPDNPSKTIPAEDDNCRKALVGTSASYGRHFLFNAGHFLGRLLRPLSDFSDFS
jgi:hypothetical protein